jgi:hypothetical protein
VLDIESAFVQGCAYLFTGRRRNDWPRRCKFKKLEKQQ